jgi:arylsulfatase A-like enzyme
VTTLAADRYDVTHVAGRAQMTVISNPGAASGSFVWTRTNRYDMPGQTGAVILLPRWLRRFGLGFGSWPITQNVGHANMKNLRRSALAMLCLAVVSSATAADPTRPNVVFILADDLGYGDLGCYGAKLVSTPNLNRLAAQGKRFTDAHAPSAVCTPTRYALMTGQYAWRHPPAARILNGVAPLCIPRGTVTVASLLRQAGYATGVVGKWHLGLGSAPTDYNGQISPGPREVGFDYSFVIPATGDRTPCVYVENHHVVGYDPSDPIRVAYDRPVGDEPTGASHPEQLRIRPSHGHDNTIINGISRIGYMSGGRSARWNDDDMADQLAAKAIGFIEGQRPGPFFLYFAIHDIHVPRVPHARFKGASRCGTRGDVIQQLDATVGQVLDALDRLRLADNTLVVFSSDNGGVMDDGYQDGSGNDVSDHRCNGPLRGFKGGLYEGGSRVPFLARWPGHIPAGQSSGELICLADLLATCAALVGAPLTDGAGPDSYDILPALLAQRPERVCREHLVTHGNGNRLAIRRGAWKLIPEPVKNATAAPELYNLTEDLAEANNLAAKHPEEVRRLNDLLQRIRDVGQSRELVAP